MQRFDSWLVHPWNAKYQGKDEFPAWAWVMTGLLAFVFIIVHYGPKS
jgi:hypothetical protein